jgi:hypothetical protein
MQLEHSESYRLIRSIEDLIDFKGLMNPGKIFFNQHIIYNSSAQGGIG